MMTISELSDRSGVSAHTLRYYERIGLMPDVHRLANGHRRYGDEHLFWIGFLRRLRAIGMSIAEISEYATLVQEGDATLGPRQQLLDGHRLALESRIEALSDSLELLQLKIRFYRERESGSCQDDFLTYLAQHGRDIHGERIRREPAA